MMEDMKEMIKAVLMASITMAFAIVMAVILVTGTLLFLHHIGAF